MTVWGYLRVSTTKQHLETNKGEILRYANEKGLYPVTFIQETVSGRKDWRKRILGQYFNENIKDGDTIIMTEYSRIGRDFLQSLEFVSMCKRRNINILSTIGDIPINNNDANSNLLLAMNSWKAQLERETIAYRTKIKLEQLKNAGVKLGRKNKMILEGENFENNKIDISKKINDGVKYKNIAKVYNCTVTTLRKFIKKYNLNQSK